MTPRDRANKRIEAFLTAHPRSTRRQIMECTGVSIGDFHSAIPALGLTSVGAARGQYWSLPVQGMATGPRTDVFSTAVYVAPEMTAPRPGSLEYRGIPSRGLRT